MAGQDLATAFAQVLREARKQKGLTQEELGDLAGLHDTYISLLERGQRQPSLETTFALADALGLKASTLVTRVEAKLD